MSKKMFFSPIGNPSPYLDKLVGYYPFNSNANDFSGKGHNGTIIGSPTFSAGKVGNAIDFINDNVLRYIDIADNDDFSFTNGVTDVPFTIAMWVNLKNVSAIGSWLISKRGATSGTDEWQLIYYENRLQFWKFQYNNNSIYQIIKTYINPLLFDNWFHFVYTDNGSGSVGSGKLYRNGVEYIDINQNVGGTYTRMNNGTNITRIGINSWGAESNLKHKGLIDELAIWKNRELTAIEVLELYTKSNAGAPLI